MGCLTREFIRLGAIVHQVKLSNAARERTNEIRRFALSRANFRQQAEKADAYSAD